MPKIYEIKNESFHDKLLKCYRKVLTINVIPEGPLAEFVKTTKREKLSPFKDTCPCDVNSACMNIILDPTNKSEYLHEEDLAKLLTFFGENGYTVDYEMSKLLQLRYRDVMFYISY